MKYSMQEVFKKIRSECKSYIYVHNKPYASSDHNNLKTSCNDDPKCDYITLKLYIYYKTIEKLYAK